MTLALMIRGLMIGGLIADLGLTIEGLFGHCRLQIAQDQPSSHPPIFNLRIIVNLQSSLPQSITQSPINESSMQERQQ
jgi:hypothetical protein